MPRISRRRFLWSTTALAATPAIGVNAGPLAGRIRIAVKYQMIQEPDLSVKQKLEMLREIGFDGVELKVDDKVATEYAIAQANARSVAQMKSLPPPRLLDYPLMRERMKHAQ